MKTGFWTAKNGTVNKGIYTTSCVPNHKPKRTRKSGYQKEEIITKKSFKCHVNIEGIIGAFVTAGFAPLDTGWKIGLVAMFLFSCIHVEVEDDK